MNLKFNELYTYIFDRYNSIREFSATEGRCCRPCHVSVLIHDIYGSLGGGPEAVLLSWNDDALYDTVGRALSLHVLLDVLELTVVSQLLPGNDILEQKNLRIAKELNILKEKLKAR